MKQLMTAAVVTFVAFACASTAAQEPASEATPQTQETDAVKVANANPDAAEDPEKAGSFWMEQKMRLSMEILAGLAESDFDRIGENAALMRGLNRVERFVRRGPEGYKDELKMFNMANRAIIRAADNENLEAATLAFNRLTVSCVSCHQSLRGL